MLRFKLAPTITGAGAIAGTSCDDVTAGTGTDRIDGGLNNKLRGCDHQLEGGSGADAMSGEDGTRDCEGGVNTA